MNFFDRYAAVCKEKGIEPCSQRAADMFNTTRATISTWNSKSITPKGETVAVIADGLGISADYLLGRTDDPTDYSRAELIADLEGPVLDRFDGDVKKAMAFQRATARDAAKDRARTPRILKLYEQLNYDGRIRAEAYIEGLLASGEYGLNEERESAAG